MGEMCYYCMTPTVTGGKCTSCGKPPYQMAEKHRGRALEAGTVMQNENSRTIVGAVIGSGGFGITYIAYDDIKKKKIALKEFFPGYMAARCGCSLKPMAINDDDRNKYEKVLRSFKRESRILNDLRKHPHIVNVYYSFDANNTAYYAMEYLEGVSLKSYINRHGPLTEKDAGLLLNPIMDAIQFVHENKTLHRDISPNNIFLVGSESNPQSLKAMLIDFGAAYVARNDYSRSVLNVRTKGYTSPEQIDCADNLQGPWSDVYSFAATMYFALTGKDPIPAERRQSGENTMPLSVFAPVSNKVQQVITKGLELNFKNRTQSMADFQQSYCNAVGIEPWHFIISGSGGGSGGGSGSGSGGGGVTSGSGGGGVTSGSGGDNDQPVVRERLIGGILEAVLFYVGFYLLVGNWKGLLFGYAFLAIFNLMLLLLYGGTLGMLLTHLKVDSATESERLPANLIMFALLSAFPPFALLDCLVNRSSATWRERLLSLDVKKAEQASNKAEQAFDNSTSCLIFRDGPDKGLKILLRDGKGIGRDRSGHAAFDPKEGWTYLKDEEISREHCIFTQRDGEWEVEDLGSTNGIFVNGVKIPANEKFVLKNGAVLKIGQGNILYRKGRQ